MPYFFRRFFLVAFAFVAVLFVVHAHPASAATCTFASTENTNDFNLAANWSCGHAPVAVDTALVPASTSTTMTASSTVASLNATGTVNAATFNLTVNTFLSVAAGATVTSTSGTLNFNGSVTSTGSIGSSSGNMTLGGGNALNNNGTIDIGSGTATGTSGGFANNASGIIHNRTGVFSMPGSFTNAGTYNAQSGTFRITGSSNMSLPSVLYNNVLSIKTAGTASFAGSSTILGTLSMNGTGGTLDANGSAALTVVGTTTLLSGTAVTTTSGTLTFNGAVSSTGSIGSSFGNMLFNSTFQNNGTYNLGGGTATTTGNLTNAGTINAGSSTGTLSVVADFNNPGTYHADSGRFRLAGGGDQTLQGAVYNKFLSIKTAGTATMVASSTVLNTFDLNGGTLSVPTSTLTTGDFSVSILAGATLTASSAIFNIGSDFSSDGTVSLGASAMTAQSSYTNTGSLDIGSGSLTSHATFANFGTTYNGSGTLTVDDGNFVQYGTFYGQTGTVRLSGSAAQQLIDADHPVSLYNFDIANTGGGVLMVADATATHITISSGTIDLNGFRLAATSSFDNTGGYIIPTSTSGALVGPTTQPLFTQNGTAVSSYTNPASMGITITDGTRNLSATTTESFLLSILANGAAGGDRENVLMVETSASSGVFQSAAVMNVKYAVVPLQYSGELEMSASGSMSFSYTDPFDASDATSTSVALIVGSTSNATSGGGSGGGSGGVGSSQALTPLVTTYQTLVSNLQALGIPVHALVKLPDDGNRNTQEDSAVYYIGSDGKRHAFPNSKVYFTWYADFSQVQVVNLTQLSSIPLGKNVTYKPGVRMVKFTTDPKTYAVDQGGVLRWIASESVATSLYGNAWNQVIDDVSDAFYVNYTFGNNINTTADFSVSGVSTVVYPE